MRALLLLLAIGCAVSPVRAQGDPARPGPAEARRLHPFEAALAGYGGYAGGVAGAAVAGLLVHNAGGSPDAALVTAALVYPLATAGATYGLGRALGADGTFGGTLNGAAVGAAVGFGAGLLIYHAPRATGPPSEPGAMIGGWSEGLGHALAVAMPYVLGPPVGALLGFNGSVEPATLVGPDGRAVQGLRVRVAL